MLVLVSTGRVGAVASTVHGVLTSGALSALMTDDGVPPMVQRAHWTPPWIHP